MAEHGALWPACGPRCIQLECNVVRCYRDTWICVTFAIPPNDKALGPGVFHEYDFWGMLQFGERFSGLISNFRTNKNE